LEKIESDGFIPDPISHNDWRSQFVTSKSDLMGLRYRPMVFTEQGVTIKKRIKAEAVKTQEASP
jgi:hypothetical protein